MNLPRYFLTLLMLVSCLEVECLGQQPAKKAKEWREMSSTPLSGEDCTPATAPEDEGGRICKGVRGYTLLIKGDETKLDIFLITPNGRRHALEYWKKDDPGFRELKNFVSWVVVNEPKTTIAVTFYLDIAPKEDYHQWGSFDVIARVDPGPVCIVGSVPGTSTAAMESMGISSSPADRPCLGLDQLEVRDWVLTARRLAREGKVQETEAALANVKKPADRFWVYADLVSAQVKAGDREGAHRTLMTARAEALKKPYAEELRFTLAHVTAGLAEAGYDEEAKADVPLYEEEDQLGMRLTIAWYQGERQDFEAAKQTYQEIIKSELDRVPRRDSNLQEVCERQARMKLYDEARNTAALIIDVNAKRMCEDYIPKQP